MAWTVKFNDTELSGIRDVQISESCLFNNGIGIITPRRATFESYVNESEIYQHIRDGSHIVDKMISEYFVELYLNGVIKFTGYIDVSKCDYNKKEELITIFCYDYATLLNLYTDEFKRRQVYGGIHSSSYYNYFDYYIYRIGGAINKTLITQNDIATPASGGENEINTIDLPTYGGIGVTLFGYGFCSPEVGTTVLHVIYRIMWIESSSEWYAFIKIHRYFAGYGFAEYASWDSGEPIDTPDTENWLEEIDNVLSSAGIDRDTYLANPFSGFYADMDLEETEIVITYTGQNIPFSFFFGKEVETPYNNEILLKNNSGRENKNCLSIIKDCLLINRATIIVKDDGTINIRNLEEELVTHVITTGILSFHTSITDVPLAVQYNLLSGYCDITKTITEAIYDDLIGMNKILEITIDNLESYDIHVSDIITVYSVDYIVKSVKRLFKQDEYKIIGWAI